MTTQDTAPEKKGKGKLFAIIGAVVVAGGAGAFFFLGGSGDASEEAAVTTTIAPVEGAVVESEEMTVNLADPTPRYARIKFAVVLPEGGDAAAVGNRFPLLKDRVLVILSRFSASDLLASGGLDEVRTHLTEEALDVWPDGEVLRVVVTEMLVQ